MTEPPKISQLLKKPILATKPIFLIAFIISITRITMADQIIDGYLNKIKLSEDKLYSCQTKWNGTIISAPEPNLNAEKIISSHVAKLREDGNTEEYINQVIRFDKSVIKNGISGSEQRVEYTCVRKGNISWCEISSSIPFPIGLPTKEENSYFINYYDGINSAHVDRALLDPGQTAKNASWSGALKRNSADAMPNVGLVNLSFLVGAPRFAKELINFKIVADSEDSFVLEKNDEEPTPGRHRIGFSKKFWRPVFEEFINSFTNRPIYHIDFTNYRLNSDDVWFPNDVKKSFFRANGDLSSTQKYELLSASFNASADVSKLLKPLPIGAVINDYRFSPRPGARYKIRKGGIPGDATVLKLVKEREIDEKYNLQLKKTGAVRNFVIPVGAIFVVAGFIWYRKSLPKRL